MKRNKMIFKCVLALVLMATTSLALSADAIRSEGSIIRLVNFEGHVGTLVRLSNMTTTEGSCPRNDFYILEETHKFYEQNYSALLAYKLADKEVAIVVDEGDCIQNLPRLKHLYLP